jgi:Tol biopolymer transport system component
MKPDGSEPTAVSPGWGEYADWAPDGRKLVYAAPPASGGDYDVVILNLEFNAEIRLDAAPGTQFAPVWSPDGERICYQSEEEAGRFEIVCIAPNGQWRLPASIGEGGWPVWSPDGLLGYGGERGFAVDDSLGVPVKTTPTNIPAGASFFSWPRTPD